MNTVTILLIILAFTVALCLAFFQYIFKNKEKSQLNYWLSFLRFLSVFTLLLLIINPTIDKNNITVIKPNLLIAIDNSASIKHSLQTKNIENLVEKLKNDAELNTKYGISYYTFGTALTTLDSLSFNESNTNLSKPFLEFSNLYKSDNNPVLLITDGNSTIGNAIEFVNYKSPVFSYIVGDTTVFEDISISKLNTNKNTYINNKLPVELFINYTGSKTVSKKLTVFDKNTKVFTKMLDFSSVDNVQEISFYLTSNTAGTHYYTAKIEALENEKNTVNNTKNFSVNVIEEVAEILVLTSVIHPDLGMLKKSIESNKQRSVTIKNINDFNEDINDYQLVILYQPNNLFKSVFTDVLDKKINYFVVSGLATDWNFLNNNQNHFKKNALSQYEEYHPFFNLDYGSFISADIGFSSFAPLEDYFGDITFSVPVNTLLFQKIGTIETTQPLLATFQKNNQKGAVLFGENSWRWRMNSFSETKTFELFDGFMSNLVQYLSSDLKNNRLNVAIKSLYYANETIKFSASYLDENYNFDPRAELWLTVTNKTTNFIKKIPFTVFNNQFNVELTNIPPGEYVYDVTVENNNTSASGSFKVVPFEVEKQFPNSNYKQLEIFSKNTKGALYFNKNSEKLISDLKIDTRFKSIQKNKVIKTPFINIKWLLGFIIFLLSIEWFLRKYYGKI
ncbi:VWA domain-containing protein [Lutibacter sp. A80]|uniref:VWA domain-containing protein n=1 Tax=Lutibacter sp. A80 TaxID=2918453 RepID=UPI001F0625B9|nr:VWA domain-containing protein [Lutibacter sp. A80]UMB61259.1 VWA domain-containing protein [Lutibacter sp. A80]